MSSPENGKRQRREGPVEPPVTVLAPIHPGLVTPESRTRLHDAYQHSGPYKHGVLRPLCDEASLRGCFEEMQAHLTGTFKETDLFKARAQHSICMATATASRERHNHWLARRGVNLVPRRL
jgi:hypothetical protein